MPKAQPGEQENEQTGDSSLHDLIGRQVIRSLGYPKDLLKVGVYPIGSDRYRVNIVTGKDFATSRITDSFFVVADANGKIVNSTPQIVKQY